MRTSLLDVFPKEIRDHIYTYILASPSGIVNLSPWTVDVARSLSILRTCKQIHRECKDIIWRHNGLALREPTQLFRKFRILGNYGQLGRIRNLKICLEIIDRDELEWMAMSMKALVEWCALESIILTASVDSPSGVEEFQENNELQVFGESLDGRLYRGTSPRTTMVVHTGWPRFSHWGKQRWLREMLLDPSNVIDLLRAIHAIFGGQLYVDGLLVFKDGRLLKAATLDPRNGEVKVVPSPGLYYCPLK